MANNIEKLLAKIEENTRGSGGAGLPAVTSEDNGDVLTVVDGVWAKAAPSGGADTFIVHVTVHWDDDNGAFVVDECDSTVEDVNHAMMAGKPCFAHIYLAGEEPMANIIPCLSGYEDDSAGVVFSLMSPTSTGDNYVGVEIQTLMLDPDPDATVYRIAWYTIAATPDE